MMRQQWWSLVVLAALVALARGKSLYAVTSRDASLGAVVAPSVDFRGRYGVEPHTFDVVVVDSLHNKAIGEHVTSDSHFIGTLTEKSQVFVVELLKNDLQFCASYSSCHCNLIGQTCIVMASNETEFLSKVSASRADIVSLPTHSIEEAAVYEPMKITAAVPVIANIISLVSENSQRDFLAKLTVINTRQAQSIGAVEAASLLASTFRSYGFTVTQMSFRNGYSDNVIAERRGATDPSKIVILGAHYDCRGQSLTSTTARAPGANDDGSGVAALVEIARILGSSNIAIPYTIRLIAFSGEEQGLYGSTAYADAAKLSKLDIVAMLQADMIAYQSGASPRLEFASRYATLSLNTDLTKLAALYVPNLAVGTTTSCCSDQQPFFSNGFPAAAYNEGGGYTIDPQYHNIGDVVDRNGYSLPQLKAITQCLFSAALTLAGVA